MSQALVLELDPKAKQPAIVATTISSPKKDIQRKKGKEEWKGITGVAKEEGERMEKKRVMRRTPPRTYDGCLAERQHLG
jgi:hypothetical protein